MHVIQDNETEVLSLSQMFPSVSRDDIKRAVRVSGVTGALDKLLGTPPAVSIIILS